MERLRSHGLLHAVRPDTGCFELTQRIQIGKVLAVCRNAKHGFSKQPQSAIRLLAGRGVEGDAHCGETVQHIYLKRRNPLAPNRMQVHLLQSELFDEVALAGFALLPGQLGENITTQGIDLLDLPLGTRLQLGSDAVVELTGLRSPCRQIEDFRPGLLKQVVSRTTMDKVLAKAGVMAIVVEGGEVRPDCTIQVALPATPRHPLQKI